MHCHTLAPAFAEPDTQAYLSAPTPGTPPHARLPRGFIGDKFIIGPRWISSVKAPLTNVFNYFFPKKSDDCNYYPITNLSQCALTFTNKQVIPD
jgi:hypothetical protein